MSRTRRSAVPAPMLRGVNYASSPLLASKTPPWRSKFVVMLVGASFCVLPRARSTCRCSAVLPAPGRGALRTPSSCPSRGRITDRNGLILAASVPVPSLGRSPGRGRRPAGARAQLPRALAMTPAELAAKIGDNQNFVWLRRQTDEATADAVRAAPEGRAPSSPEYRRKYPEGEAAAHVVGFTGIEDRGQEGIELAFEKDLTGPPRHPPRHQGPPRPAGGGHRRHRGPCRRPGHRTRDRQQVQFFAYQRVREAAAEHKAKAGSVVVLDVAQTGEVLALANYPSYVPGERRGLSGANCATAR